MFASEKIFNVYEKPEAADPADRLVLVREGFSFWALIFGALWLVAQRLWLVLAMYLGAVIVLGAVGEALRLPEPVNVMLQFLLQLGLAYHAYDLHGLWLTRRGYRLAGVLAAESEFAAERRYYEFAR